MCKPFKRKIVGTCRLCGLLNNGDVTTAITVTERMEIKNGSLQITRYRLMSCVSCPRLVYQINLSTFEKTVLQRPYFLQKEI